MTEEWFKSHPKITKLNWPAKAADLNPIENVWGIMVNQLVSENASKEVLWTKVQQVWKDLSKKPNIWTRLSSSMPDRLSECIKVGGHWTKY